MIMKISKTIKGVLTLVILAIMIVTLVSCNSTEIELETSVFLSDGSSEVALYSTNADIVGLSTLERNIYNALRDFAVEVANGERIYTTVSVSTGLESLTWTQSQLGCTLVSNGNITTSAYNAVARKVKSAVNFDKIYHTLLAELPYELYWHDKTVGYTCNYKLSGNSSYMSVVEIEFSFTVSRDYISTVSSTKYAVSAPAIEYAAATIPFAKSIVTKYSSLADEEKLFAYANEICSLVEYNHSATAAGTPYGNPWQLAYVFDNNPNTNVVCEGYAKAFKLLCDLSVFKNDVKCYLVCGLFETASSSEGHMWNVVSINGANYLVDVTMLDGGSEARVNDTFLLTGVSSDNNCSHIVSWGKGTSVTTATYTYRESQYGIYSSGYLALSEPAPHIHEYNSQIYHDASGHWRCCECGEPSPVEPHNTSLYPATCSRPAICSDCATYVGGLGNHAYTEKNATESFLISKATCTTPAVYYYSCQCGKRGNTTFTVGDALEHEYTVHIVRDTYLAAEATCTSKATYFYTCQCGAIGDTTFEVGGYKAHVYDQCNTDEKYLIRAASCYTSAIYFCSCECGARGGETFTSGEPSHEYDKNGNCILCGKNINSDINDDVVDEDFNDDNYVDITPEDNKNENPENNNPENNNPVVNYESYPWIIRIILMILALILGL